MNKLKAFFQVLFASFALSIAYEIKLAFAWDTVSRVVILVAASVLASLIISNGLVFICSKSRLIRMLALNRAWIEGYWHLQTFNVDKSDPVSHVLMHISYVGSDFDLNVVGYKAKDPDGHLRTVSNSQLVTINPQTLEYINYFDYRPAVESIFGIAHGRFDVVGWHFFPTRYDGTLKYFAEMQDQKQLGHKISHLRILKYISRFKTNWEYQLLKDLEG